MKTRRLLIALALGLGLTGALMFACVAAGEAGAERPAPSLIDRDMAGSAPAGLPPEAWKRILHQVQRDRLALAQQTAKITAGDGTTNDHFGYAVAVDGDTAIVGAEGDDGSTGAAYIFERHLGGVDNWGQRAKLTATLGAPGDYFGAAVAIDGDRAVVGASGADSFTGAAYVFARNQGGADSWGQVATITAAGGTGGDRLGAAVAIDGDTVVAGTPGADSSTGAAYVFSRNAGGADNWGQVQEIAAAGGAVSDFFGCAVAVDGDTIVVGAYYGPGGTADSGAAYVFSRNQGGADSWGQVAKIAAAGGLNGDRFGFSVALRQSTIVVGAPFEDANAGAAYVFRKNVGGVDNWGQVAAIAASDGTAGAYFGWSVAIGGDAILVGAPYGGSGAAYVFGQNVGGADNWGQSAKLSAGDGESGDLFGYGVGFDGGTVLVGAYGDGDNGAASGSAYVFAHGGVVWEEEARPAAEDGRTSDGFGYAVAMEGEILVVGATFGDGPVLNSGAAYVLGRNEGGADKWGQMAKLTATDTLVMDQFGYAVAVEGDTVAVGAPYHDHSSAVTDTGAVYVFARNEGGADRWGQVTKITATDSITCYTFGYSVGLDGSFLVVGAPAWRATQSGANAGVVHVFERNAGGIDNWGSVAVITAADGLSDDRFGNAVAIDGDTIVVGATGDDAPSTNSGSAYVFSRNAGGADNWGQTAHISHTDSTGVDFFGHAVDIDGGTIVVGAIGADDGCPWSINCNSGAAYVFERNVGGTDHWGQAAKITATDSITYDQFGVAVAVDGDRILVGAHQDDDLGDNAGSAYLFARNEGGAGNWGLEIKFNASNGKASDRFGKAVAVEGDVALVGSQLGDGAFGNSGLTYLYRKTLLDVMLPLVIRNY